jgi:menaquinone-9 beta-reductase
LERNPPVLGKVVIIGGGLAGLICGIRLAKVGVPCLLIEKKSYPLHRVCGEYVSNETVPFLQREGLFPEEFFPPHIDDFVLTSVTGKESKLKLQLGGFGISRYAFDHFLYLKAKALGVEFLLNTEVTEVTFDGDDFSVISESGDVDAKVVIGAFGKRSRLDVQLKREFITRRSPYVGVKYHVRGDHAPNQIALHNFEGGYCGVNNVEDGISNVCYMTRRETLQRCGSINALENIILKANPHLNKIFSESEFLFAKPEVINEISFEVKGAVEEHILMIGDSAGMIAPLCGNGMAMAIHTAKIAAEIIPAFVKNKISRHEMESRYAALWKQNFEWRLWKGRNIQRLFGNRSLSGLAVNLAIYSRPFANYLVRSTHGQTF